MRSWNTGDHRIADTEHGSIRFADGSELVIADWQFTEDAPDRDGRVYASIRGWLANGSGSGTPNDPYTEPVEAGRARLVRADLRGREPLTDRDVHVDYYNPGQPYPNTWDHQGCLVTVTWLDRRIDEKGLPIEDDEVGSTVWTHPQTGQIFDLSETYLPTGDYYHPQNRVWRHFDRWRGGILLLQPFYGDQKSPAGDGSRLLTDGEWILASAAPTFEQAAAANAPSYCQD